MKRIIGVIMIGLMILGGAQAAYARGHGGHSGHGGHGHSRCHGGGGNRGLNGWETFGAVCAGVLGAGLIAAAFSDCCRPAAPCYTYPPPPPPPPPVYQRTVYYVPVYR